MNRKQRMFGDVCRLMRSHRHMITSDRGKRFNTGGGGGGGGATATLEYPKIEMPTSFAIKDPGKDVPEALEKIRLTMVDLDGRGKLTAEAFKKMVDQIEDVQKAAFEARESARNLVRQVPGPQDPNAPIRCSRIPLSMQVRGETDPEFTGEFARLERSRVGLVQYNLLTRTADELGIADEGDREQLKRLKGLHDASSMMNLAHSHDAAYFTQGAHLALPWAKEQAALAKKWMTRLTMNDTTAGEGVEWIQINLLSSQLQELVELDLEFSGIFQVFPMRAATMKWPVAASRARMVFLAENIAADGVQASGTITPANWVTSDKTYTARKGGAGVVLTTEWEEDAIVNGPLYAQADLAAQHARGREEAIVNGQRSGAIDGGVIAAGDLLNMWDGIRKMFRQTGKPAIDMGAGITAETLASMFGVQGVYGAKVRDCAWLTGPAGLARLMIAKAADNSPLFLTLDKAGDSFALRTGALGVVFGRPVYVSEFVSDKMLADGTLDDYTTPTGTKTAIYHLYHRCMKIGQRRGVMISRSDEQRFYEEQVCFKSTTREDFQSNITNSATKVLVMEGNNIATF